MLILIHKDSANKVAKEVKDVDEARAFEANGFVVEILNEDNSTAPLPAEEVEVVEHEGEPVAKKVAAKKSKR